MAAPDVRAVEDEAGTRETVAAVLRGCRLLGHFSASRPVIGLAELAAESRMNKPTVHRLMSTFVEAGWVSRDPAGAYRVRLDLFAIGAAALSGFDLRTEARPEMQALADAFGDTAYLMVPSAHGAVCIEKIDGGKPLVVAGIAVGTVLPFHAAAGPVAMLAFDDELRARALADGLPAFTPATRTDPADLTRHLDAVRAAGVAQSHGDYLEGVSAVAAPLLGPGERVLGTLSLGGRSDDFAGAAGDERGQAVRAAADRLSALLRSAPA
ncbi:IclR family transcriptional regulator [Actinomycetospora sp. OC33-EN08]|uniref:IclR family transcriptional regulator n=1 Tax=Actinomycetospora aurantiaca TaxID=3129233 RepID=A0ABU8MI65_9PSEU